MDNELLVISDSPTEMARKLDDMKNIMDLTQQFFKKVMIEGQDYGVIPGTDKPTLYKSGAEKLNELYGYAVILKDVSEEKNYENGFYRARVSVQLVHKKTGVVIAEGVGEANVYESRYRFRWVYDNEVPQGIDKSTLKSKEFESKKTGKSYSKYRLENENFFDLWNTVLKMAKKRGLVDATLSATRSSGIFTQDIEDMQEWASADQEQTPANKTNNASKSNVNAKYECEECGIEIKQAEAAFSKHNYGRSLCRGCQAKAKEAAKQRSNNQDSVSEYNDFAPID